MPDVTIRREEAEPQAGPRFLERHYLAGELAERWHVSRTTVVKWAKAEGLQPQPIGFRKATAHRKGSRLGMLRIPASMADQIHEKYIIGQRRGRVM